MSLLNTANKVFVGNAAVDRVYLGSNLVWQSEAVVENPNLLVNGDFSGGTTTGWTVANGGVLSVENGALKMTKTSGSNCFFYQSVAVQAGKNYEIKVEVLESVGNTGIRLGNGPAQLTYLNSGAVGPRQFVHTYSPTSDSNLFLSVVYVSSVVGEYGLYDNMSIREIL